MNKKFYLLTMLALTGLMICSTLILAVNSPAGTNPELKSIQLLPPQTDGGKPLMQVLKDRKSSREFGAEKLPPQILSNLLWAANGINRQDSGKRTAPSAVNWQEIDVYVAMAEGLYLYDAKGHVLKPVLAQDVRAATGRQEFVKDVPVNLIYVADFTRMGDVSAEEKVFYSAADTGFIAENVYLYCASEGLATVVRNLIDKPALSKIMKLRAEQRVILAQSVGYPKKQQ
ncbi:MAG: nitroreductase [Planctomycetes bacterium RBG_13_46_10]|nr:MAG: nitroreductase [Planctomycetes bacterium RBG_13_46_10]